MLKGLLSSRRVNALLPWLLGLGLVLAFFPLTPRLDYAIDLSVYAEAGAKALAHQSPYDATVYYQYKYAPMIALGMGAAFHAIPMPSMIWVHFYLFLSLWAVWILWTTRLLSRAGWVPKAWAPWLPAMGFLFFGAPLAEELHIGQVNVLPLLLLTAFFHGLPKWRPIWTGLLFGLAVCLKLYALLAVPFLVFQFRRREWAILIWSGVWALGLNLVIVGLYSGFEFAVRDFITWLVNLKSSSADLVTFRFNASLLGVFSKILGLGLLASMLWAGCVAAFVWVQWRLRSHHALVTLAWVLGGVVVLNPLVWSYWVPLLFPLLGILIAKQPWTQWAWGRRVFAGLGFLTMAVIFQMHHSYFNRELALQVAAVTLLCIFAGTVLRSSGRPSQNPL